jgi:hypothetical protein
MNVTAQAFEVLVRIRMAISHMRERESSWPHGPETVRDDMKARNIYSHLESDDSGILDDQSEWKIYNPNEAPFMRKRIASNPIVRIFDLGTHSKRSPITRPIVRKLLSEKSLGSF